MAQANTASLTAVLKFVRGPEKGKRFEVRDELVHLGRGDESHIRLRAKDLQDYELSIVLRNNRFAVYSSRDDAVSVEGNVLPAEKWVWLPERTLVKIGKQTEFEFEVQSAGEIKQASEKSSSKESAAGEDAKSGGSRNRSKSRGPKSSSSSGKKSGAQPVRKSAVARFITDQVGDPLVQLGEDGTLPELHLEEASGGTKRKKAETDQPQKNEGNPLLVGIALAFSVVSSTILLLVDVGAGGGDDVDKTTARREVQSFYGGNGDELEDYQILLREAALAHSREDFDAEERYYRQVLRMLVSEDNQGLIRLTENRERDQELRDLLSVLLAE